MLRIAVCDDNKEFQILLINALNNFCERIFPKTLTYEISEGFNSAEDVLKYIENDDIDVLFLDIDMPGIGGLELARRLSF